MPHIINVKATEDVTMQPDFPGDVSSLDGRVVKEGVAGILVAASPMQLGVNDRVLPRNQLESKPKKLKNGSGRPREFLSLYPEGAENIKGVLQQIVKKKEEDRKQGLEEHGVFFQNQNSSLGTRKMLRERDDMFRILGLMWQNMWQYRIPKTAVNKE